MIVHECEQGTSEWLALRAGIPTASNFDSILTKGGKPSASAERYMYTLLAERLLQRPIEEHVSFWMQRGSEMEAEALRFYEFQRECDTEQVGFITNDAGTIGASPDRLVGEYGLLEIKCPREWVHMSYVLQSGKAVEEYKCQAQGQLWIAERQWTDVISYHPELPMAMMRVERDEKFIEQLSKAVTAFSDALEETAAMLIDRGAIASQKEKVQPSASQVMREVLLEMQRDRAQA